MRNNIWTKEYYRVKNKNKPSLTSENKLVQENIVLFYVHKNNIRAIRFYQKMGYTQVSMEDIKKLGIVTERTDANAMNWYYVCKSKLEE